MSARSAGSERPLRADAQRNRERLLEVAAEAFAERGPDVSVDEIASRAGLGMGTLYRHFPTKELLLAAVVRQRLLALRDATEAFASAEDTAAALTGWLTALLGHVQQFAALAGPLRCALSDADPTLAAIHEEIMTTGARILRRAQQGGEARADVDAADLVATVVTLATAPAQQDPDASRRMLALVLRGVLAQ